MGPTLRPLTQWVLTWARRWWTPQAISAPMHPASLPWVAIVASYPGKKKLIVVVSTKPRSLHLARQDLSVRPDKISLQYTSPSKHLQPCWAYRITALKRWFKKI